MEKTERYLNNRLLNRHKSAERRNIECTVTYEDIETLFSRNEGFCDYTGLRFVEKDLEKAASVERIDDNLGYVRGNLCLVSIDVNQIKDSLLDKKIATKLRIDERNFHIFACLKFKLTPDYMQYLKDKYNPEVDYKKEEDKYLRYFEEFDTVKPIPSTKIEQPNKQEEEIVIQKPKAQNVIVPQIAVNREPKAEPTQDKVEVEHEMPEDVLIAGYYSALAKAAKKGNINFNISYTDFKVKYRGKRCKFTQKTLQNHDKFMLMLDKTKPFDRDNIVLVDEGYGHKLEEMSNVMGLSVSEMAKMFKRLL